MASGSINESSNIKYETLISKVPFDHAANIVLNDCPKCDSRIMALVRISENNITMYSCVCGYKVSVNDYLRNEDKSSANVATNASKARAASNASAAIKKEKTAIAQADAQADA